jgi:hypothetical protein
MKIWPLLLALALAWAPAIAAANGGAAHPALHPIAPELSADEIVARAFNAAGGETWRRPSSILLKGYMVQHKGSTTSLFDEYRMWRVYDWEKKDAHAADGKVRIEGRKSGKIAFLMGFDGRRTFNLGGYIDDESANVQWASNFGFGAIRHAFDEGWRRNRLPDDLVDGRPSHFIELTDPSGGVTRFGIDVETYQVLLAGFSTPRGWHERIYSDFYSKPGVSWTQPGRVRLFYDGVKQNEVIWTDFDLNAPMPDKIFTPKGSDG